MKTVALTLAVFGVWAVPIVLYGRLFPRNEKSWERMEDATNDGCQTSILLMGLGVLSTVIVLACAIAFGVI